MKHRLKATITLEYKVDSKYYPSADVAEMCKIDAELFQNNRAIFMKMIETNEYAVKVERASRPTHPRNRRL